MGFVFGAWGAPAERFFQPYGTRVAPEAEEVFLRDGFGGDGLGFRLPWCGADEGGIGRLRVGEGVGVILPGAGGFQAA